MAENPEIQYPVLPANNDVQPAQPAIDHPVIQQAQPPQPMQQDQHNEDVPLINQQPELPQGELEVYFLYGSLNS